MNDLSWNSFTKKIYIKAPAETIFNCWVNSKGLESWFLSQARNSRQGKELNLETAVIPGDSYVWRWHNWDGFESGEFIEVEANSKLVFTFVNTLVTVSIKEENGVSLVSLTQSNIPTDEKSRLEIFYGCSNGWTFWMANLKAFLEHGILLNETEQDLTGLELAGFEFVNI